MRVRKLDASGDMQFGNGSANYYVDQPEAVGQKCWTRMRLWQGQWYLNTPDGTPWQTKILGKYTENTRDPALRARVLATDGVVSIAAYSSSLDPNSRKWSVAATIDTRFGAVTIQGPL